MSEEPPSELCPQCGAQGAGHVIRNVYDGVLYFSCPRDYTRYHRFPVGHPLREQANKFVEMNPA